MTIPVNGKAQALVQDAEAYRRLLDIAARADVFEAIRQGLDDAQHGRTRPAREVFAEFRRRRYMEGQRADEIVGDSSTPPDV